MQIFPGQYSTIH